MLPKSKIRLSRSLHAQTTPYPDAVSWLKRGFLLLMILAGLGIYWLLKPSGQPSGLPDEDLGKQKQILGEQENKSTQYAIYTIEAGDTLFNLSQRYGVSWQTLAELNNLKEPYTLKIGQKIKIPASE